MNLLENLTTTKKQFTSLAKGASDYKVSANGINKDFENIKDAIATFEMICEMSNGKLKIVSTSMHNNSVSVTFTYFKADACEVSNMVEIQANFF